MDAVLGVVAVALVAVSILAYVLKGRLDAARGEAEKAQADAQQTKDEFAQETERLRGVVRSQSEKAQADAQQTKDEFAQETERLRGVVRSQLASLDAQLAAERSAMKSDATRIELHLQTELAKALALLEPLRKYEGVADIEAQGQRLLAEAMELAVQIRERSEQYAVQAKSRTDVEIREAANKVEALRAEAEVILSKAITEARHFVDEAHAKATEIAGSAYVALREKDSLEQSVRAIRNVIDGYGDRYVIPTRSILDELAASYGHLEAGEALKVARAHSRMMVEQGHAAVCDYAEAKRKETAIRFVIDAFNGRVDAILSRSRNDNLGTLKQEIEDAYGVVNLNGEAFRNARILEAYRDSRLAELKWAVAVQELRQRDREEQRRIQEQIREEEKAQREIERALRDAAKEEDTLKKALEKARAEVEAASQEQKAKFEDLVLELNRRLAEAEAKNQRALSMAQQTRAGHIYIISNIGSFGEDVVKIGMTRRLEPMDRVRELGDAAVPFRFDVHAMIYTTDAPTLEKELHHQFDEHRLNRVNYRKEFFRVPISKLREVVVAKNLSASFTMAAEAREYRESMALGKIKPAEASQLIAAAQVAEMAEES